MSAQPTRTQKPLLLPGIAPHLFQSRTPTHLQRKMVIVKNTPEGPVTDHDHARTPSDGSTVVAPTIEDVQAVLRKICASALRGLRRSYAAASRFLQMFYVGALRDLRYLRSQFKLTMPGCG
ncbi:hypothetical protein B0H13DRAFT_1866732 [Mycena leptocephala]|nr:hypothetical protein B0H13DRAFT_1866732 [Mycena leptocephala]